MTSDLDWWTDYNLTAMGTRSTAHWGTLNWLLNKFLIFVLQNSGYVHAWVWPSVIIIEREFH